MRCWLLAVGPTYLSRILANAALNNTQVVTKLRLYVTEQACPRPNMSVVDERTVCKCVSPIIALLLSTTGGIAGTTTDALGSARFTAASANPVAPAYRCSAVNGRVGHCGHLRPALLSCASLSWAHGSTGPLDRDSAQICAESWIVSIRKVRRGNYGYSHICLFSRTATNLLTYLCSRLEWFRFNESAHVVVKQKTLATDLSRSETRLGEKQFPIKSERLWSNPVKCEQFPVKSEQFLFLELWLKSTYLPAYVQEI